MLSFQAWCVEWWLVSIQDRLFFQTFPSPRFVFGMCFPYKTKVGMFYIRIGVVLEFYAYLVSKPLFNSSWSQPDYSSIESSM